ncbi:DUF3301 domain-containing protein [Thalassolituus sp.]|jgi:hypothetical protein|uniref:DUF3301 domain-containing protein n=1 Tax=Thalassolituus sp. TaxID=2030822 RepID=UPI002A7EEC4E|nr:DUF3301 domain-containing protein [Thalassolituus sp.]|tara:strand:- start:4496 stop:4807 length:312 start_codon:yes stop_codon:yes gene_type:complete
MLLLIAVCAVFAVFYLGWSRQQRARSLALGRVRRQCEADALQLLDDTLILESMRFKWRKDNTPVLSRCYAFEFTSTGDERYAGYIQLEGYRVTSLQLMPHRVQ